MSKKPKTLEDARKALAKVVQGNEEVVRGCYYVVDKRAHCIVAKVLRRWKVPISVIHKMQSSIDREGDFLFQNGVTLTDDALRYLRIAQDVQDESDLLGTRGVLDDDVNWGAAFKKAEKWAKARIKS